MGTAVSDVILNYGMTAINDDRLYEEQSTNPALFLRKMSVWLKQALPYFERPREVKEWLSYEEPTYEDYEYVVEATEYQSITVETGKTGYELCSVGFLDRCDGMTTYTPITDFVYYPANGNVVIYSEEIQESQTIEFDFFKDGEFDNELPEKMKQIIGLCMQYVWQFRFAGDWLTQAAKINDKSFGTKGTEANETRSNTERMRMIKEHLDSEQLAFEQSLYYSQTVPNNAKLKMPEA